MIKVKLLSKNGFLPVRANPTDAGADLFSPISVYIPATGHVQIPLGIALEIPEGYAGFIYARSSLGTKFGIRPRNCVGVIDSKYRGEIGLILENHSSVPYQISKGERVAQIVISPIIASEIIEVNELDMTDDRKGGFGSTGK